MSNEPGSNTSGVAQSNVKQTSVDVSQLSSATDTLASNAGKLGNAIQNVSAAMAAHNANLQTLVNSVAKIQEQTAAAMSLASAEDKMAAKGKEFIESLKQQAETLKMSKQEMLQYQAAQLGVSAQAAPFIEALGHTDENMNKLSFSSEATRKQLLGMAADVSKGNWDKLGDSLMGLAESTGLMKLALTPAGTAITLVAIAANGLFSAMAKGAQEQKAMNDALIMTGGYAGVTSDALHEMARAAAASGGNLGEAKRVATELAGSGKYTSEQIGTITRAVIEMEHATGVSIDKVIKDFESLAAGGQIGGSSDAISNAIVKLDDQYHFLTGAVYDQIRALEEEGKAKEASKVATDAFAEAMESRSSKVVEDLGYVATAWEFVKKATSIAGDEIGGWGKRTTEASEVLRLQKELAALERGGKPEYVNGHRFVQNEATNEVQKKAVIDQLATAQENLNRVNQIAQKQSEDKIRSSEAVHAKQQISAMLLQAEEKSQDGLTVALKRYDELLKKIRADSNTEIADPQLSEATIAKNKKIIADSFATKKPDDSRQIAEEAIASEGKLREIRNKGEVDDIETSRKLGTINQYEYERRMQDIAFEDIAFKKMQEGKIIGLAGTTNLQKIQHQNVIKALDAERDMLEKGNANKALLSEKQATDDTLKSIEDEKKATSSKLEDAIKKQQQLNEEMQKKLENKGKEKKLTEDTTVAELEYQAALTEFALSEGKSEGPTHEINQARLDQIRAEIELQKSLKTEQDKGKTLTKEVDAKKAQKELNDLFDPDRAVAFSHSFKGAMAQVVDSIFKVDAALKAATATKKSYDEQVEKAETASNGDKDKLKIEMARIDQKNTENQLANYAQLAGAAKGFFNENSRGYKAMEAAEKVLQIVQLGTVLARLTGIGAVSAAGTAATSKSIAESAWDFIKAAPAAIAKGGSQAGLVGMAVMAAAMAALGFASGALGGGDSGGGKSAADMQKEQGTGSVFGDALAKSNSISKSIDILKSNSNLMLPVNQGMLAALKNIEASMAGLTNLIVRTPGLTDGTNMGIATGTLASGDFVSNSITSLAKGLFGNSDGGIAVGLANRIAGFLSKTTATIVDSGLQFGGKVSDLQNGVGYNQYASVDTTTSKLGGLIKRTSNSMQMQGVSSEVSAQFGLIFTNLESALKLAAKGLGSSADSVSKIFEDMTLTTTKISLKGLTGSALTEALNAVISKAMDEMAQKTFPGLDAFRQVGEGYAQTVIRVASGVEVAGSELSKFGITAIKFSDVINKQGDVAAEIVRQSITGVEVMRTHYDAANTGATVYGTTLTGVGKIMETMSGTASELTTVYQQLLDVRKLLRAGNIDDKSLNLDMIQGAGGVTKLSDGASNYADKYFTDAEKNAFAVKELNADFTKLGITVIPQTRKEFRDLVEGIDRSTESGSRLFGSLMTISEAFDKVATANDQTAVTKQRHAMEIQIMELSGNAAGATAIKRADELAAMDASLRPLQERIYALNDEQTAIATAKQHRELDIQLMEALGNSEGALTARRAIALAGMDEYSQGVQKQIYAITDAKTKAAEAAATDKQHRQLDIDLMEAMGNTEAATAARRAMALEGLDDYSQGVQRQIYAAQDAKAAIQKAKEAADAEAQKAEQEKQAAQQAYDQRLSAAKTALQNAYNAESSALQNVINKMQSFETAARAMQNTLISAATSPVSVADQYASAKADLPNVISKLREGDQDSISKLQEFVNLSQQSSTDFDDYRRDFALAQITLDESALAAERQIKQSQTQLDLLKSQVDGLLQVDQSVLSVADAIRELQNVTAAGLNGVTNAVSGQVAAKAAEDAAKKAANTASSQYGFANGLSYGRDAVSSAYTPPSQGDAQAEYAKYIEFATRWAKENFDTSTGFAQSVTTDVANMLMQSHDSGNFSDDQVLTGGKAYADTVYTRQYGTTTGQGLSQQDNSEMLEELRLMRAEMRAVVSNTKDTSKTLDRWTNVGLPTTETA
ncbi:phage tail length tape measure family protein [Undibacterium sp. Ji49W]|uniref:phage tail length tape measure family protein n=1 Tax=Undibacterium sp. Ji49W TaxID=3413040 RepID=UPI003BF424B8